MRVSHARRACPEHPILRRARRPPGHGRGTRGSRHHPPVPDPGADPAGRPARPRHHRPGQDRHRQDPRLRHPAAAARRRHRRERRGLRRCRSCPASRRRSSSYRPASCASRSPGPEKAAARRQIRVLAVYGGRAYEPQVEALKQGVEVVVGTPGPAARPGPAGPPRPRARPQPGARRGRRDARPRLPARRRADRPADPRRPPDHAVLGHHAGRDHHPGPLVHAPPDAHPRGRPRRRRPDRQGRRAARVPGARDGQGRDAGPHPAGRRAAA